MIIGERGNAGAGERGERRIHGYTIAEFHWIAFYETDVSKC
jgi:hypothetical protein